MTNTSKPKPRQELDTDDPERKALVDRLYAGGDKAWLGRADLAKVLGCGTSTVGRHFDDGTIRFRLTSTRGRYRLGDPADVLALLFPDHDE